MTDKYLVVNAGSSSLKFSLYEMPSGKEIVNGYIEKIGQKDSFYTLKSDKPNIEKSIEIKDHMVAVDLMINELVLNNFIVDINEIKGVGHRILHGGEFYSESVLIDDDVLTNIKSLIKFGPLHLPGELDGIESMQICLPNVPQVAVFDTSFNQTIPEENYIYPVPYDWYKENGVRRYGFHGTSHKYITERMQKEYDKKDINLIVCHIGSGASISCIKNGKCYDITMGLTPLDGLMMGTRSGAIDPSIIEYICKERNLTVSQVTDILNKQSGLKGISGYSDLRDVTALAQKGDHNAKLAIKLYEKSIIKYIAQYYFELEGNVDAIVFTAGVGENMAYIREDVINAISAPMNIKVNKEVNDSIAKFKKIHSGKITTEDSNIDVVVMPTNEEYMILRDAYDICNEVKKHNQAKTLKLESGIHV